MKFKNLLMQWFILTPLTLVHSMCGIMLILLVLDAETREELMGSMGGVGIFVMPLLIIGICFVVSKVILKVRGKTVEDSYFDDQYEYEIVNDYDDHFSVRQTRGGWTTSTRGIVWLYMIISPATFVFQLVHNLFAFIALFTKRIASWYGGINYETFDHPFLQKVLHLFFGIVALKEGYTLSK